METRTEKIDNKGVRDVLDGLIETCRDGQNGYRDAAEHVKTASLKSFFNEQSLERARYAGELENEVQRLGEHDPDKKGSASAAVHRAWIDLKANLGGGEKTILESVEQGEDVAKKAYEEALEKNLPEDLKSTIRRQAQGVFAAHDRAKTLRDQYKAA